MNSSVKAKQEELVASLDKFEAGLKNGLSQKLVEVENTIDSMQEELKAARSTQAALKSELLTYKGQYTDLEKFIAAEEKRPKVCPQCNYPLQNLFKCCPMCGTPIPEAGDPNVDYLIPAGPVSSLPPTPAATNPTRPAGGPTPPPVPGGQKQFPNFARETDRGDATTPKQDEVNNAAGFLSRFGFGGPKKPNSTSGSSQPIELGQAGGPVPPTQAPVPPAQPTGAPVPPPPPMGGKAPAKQFPNFARESDRGSNPGLQSGGKVPPVPPTQGAAPSTPPTPPPFAGKAPAAPPTPPFAGKVPGVATPPGAPVPPVPPVPPVTPPPAGNIAKGISVPPVPGQMAPPPPPSNIIRRGVSTPPPKAPVSVAPTSPIPDTPVMPGVAPAPAPASAPTPAPAPAPEADKTESVKTDTPVTEKKVEISGTTALVGNMAELQNMFHFHETATGIVLDKYIGTGNSSINVAATIDGKPIVAVAARAFLREEELVSIAFGEHLKLIGSEAFYGCTNLKKVDLPDSLDKIKTAAFMDCPALEEISLPSSMTDIGAYAFANDKSITEIAFPEGIKWISEFTMSKCSGLKKLTLPDGLRAIETSAFAECSSLEGVDMPMSLVSIGDKAFYNCRSLNKVTMPPSITRLGTRIFFPKMGQNMIPKLTVFCSNGSQAHEFCKKNSIKSKASADMPATAPSMKNRAYAVELAYWMKDKEPSDIQEMKDQTLKVLELADYEVDDFFVEEDGNCKELHAVIPANLEIEEAEALLEKLPSGCYIQIIHAYDGPIDEAAKNSQSF